jgi:hypothetical protein
MVKYNPFPHNRLFELVSVIVKALNPAHVVVPGSVENGGVTRPCFRWEFSHKSA